MTDLENHIDTSNIGQQISGIQCRLSRDFSYVRDRSLVYSEIQPGQYVSAGKIKKEMIGNCNEGFVLMANENRDLGLNVRGLAVYPLNSSDEPGHIVAVYQDPLSLQFGTAGVSDSDFSFPYSSSVYDIAESMILLHGWTVARVEEVTLKDEVFGDSEEYITLRTKDLGEINLHDKFGISLYKEQDLFGEFEVKILEGGYRASFSSPGIIFEDAPNLIRGQQITSMSFSYNNGCLSSDLNIRPSQSEHTSFLFLYEKRDNNWIPTSLHIFHSNIKEVGGKAQLLFLLDEPTPTIVRGDEGKFRPINEDLETVMEYSEFTLQLAKMIGLDRIHEFYERVQGDDKPEHGIDLSQIEDHPQTAAPRIATRSELIESLRGNEALRTLSQSYEPNELARIIAEALNQR